MISDRDSGEPDHDIQMPCSVAFNGDLIPKTKTHIPGLSAFSRLFRLPAFASERTFDPRMLIRFADGVFSDLRKIFRHYRTEGFRSTVDWLHSLEAPVTFQFVKYVFFGGMTTIVHVGLFTWFSHTIFPAHDYLVEGGIADDLQEKNAIFSNLLSFPFAAVVNYLLNVKFVFTSGRHARHHEIMLFVGISFVSFAAGLLCGPFLISRGLNPWIAQGGLVVGSALVNFVCRKFLVFAK